MNGILLFFHCSQDSQYAIPTLEQRFQRMAQKLVADEDNIHFSYIEVSEGASDLPGGGPHRNVIEFDPTTDSPAALERLSNYISEHRIDCAFGFDAPVRRRCYRMMRKAGVESIVSYWGAPMSSLNSGLKLMLRKLEVRLNPWRPDHFIFESNAMSETAILGRGIPERDVSVVRLGVDPQKFSPDIQQPHHLTRQFGIPQGRNVLVFSGHLEERKGVDVLMRAARILHEDRGRSDFHVLVLGNQPGQETPYLELVSGTGAREHVTFGGYRNDMEEIFSHCSIGVLPSTGWDSFTVSALEMAASGLPLVVSELQGLTETVDEQRTGLTFPPGDQEALADRLEHLLDRPDKRETFGRAARARVLDEGFTDSQQVEDLVAVCRSVHRS